MKLLFLFYVFYILKNCSSLLWFGYTYTYIYIYIYILFFPLLKPFGESWIWKEVRNKLLFGLFFSACSAFKKFVVGGKKGFKSLFNFLGFMNSVCIWHVNHDHETKVKDAQTTYFRMCSYFTKKQSSIYSSCMIADWTCSL